MANEFIDIDKLQKNINSAFEKLNKSVFGSYKRPSITISQNEKNVLVNAEMPGLKREDITLKVHHLGLEIIGDKKQRTEKKTKESYSETSSYKGYKVFVSLPANVNIDRIKAEYKNDKLKVIIPKNKTKLGKRIEVR